MTLSEWKVCRGWLTRSPLGNTEGRGNFGLTLLSLAFSQGGANREGGRAKMCRGWHCMCKHMLPILQLLSLFLTLEGKGKTIWLCSVLQ